MRPIDIPRSELGPPIPGPTRSPASLFADLADVRVTALTVEPPTSPDDATATVQACIHLGALLPADVRVDLISAPRDADAHVPSMCHRLCSVLSYRNGSYLFEASIVATELPELRDVAIRVSPAQGGAAAAREATVVLPSPQREEASSGRGEAPRASDPEHLLPRRAPAPAALEAPRA
jgi:hypothetical protein